MRLARALAALATAGALAASAAGPAAVPAEPRPADALRVAAFAERILELQAQEGMGVLDARGRRGRRAAAAALHEFDASVRAIGVPAAPADLHEAAALLVLLAADYRTWAQRPASRENARKLAERAEEIAWQATKLSRLLADDPLGYGPLAARAEEASALAQRIARLVLWKRWGLAGASWARDLAAAESGLEAALGALREAAASAPDALAELQLAQNQAEFLLAAAGRIAQGSADPHDLETAAKAADNAHESMQRLAAPR
ncbi:MAG TPA: hypothetical protein VHQ02_05430 [Usitatibacter sp.]|nr:hypothetical protein [Usitatibacter sp.]